MKGIYCIDDDRLITTVLKFQLSNALKDPTFHVEVENETKVLWEKMTQDHAEGVEPIVCIVDFQMPDMQGDEFIRIVKERFPEVRVIMLSGNSNALLVSDLEEEGLLDFYVTKPWDKDDLLGKVNLCLPLNLKFM
jgi:DNA-binding NtrC family response regulator